MHFKDISNEITAVAAAYEYHKPPGVLVWLQEMISDALRYINDWLSSFQIIIPGLADSRMVGNVMQVALYIAGAVAALVLVLAVWSRFGQLSRQSTLARRGLSASAVSLDAAGWRKEADSLAATGEYGAACRALYLSLLQTLHENGIIAYAPAKTNFEYGYALADHGPIQTIFKELCLIVESIWFGGRSAGQPEYSACLGLYEQAVSAVEAAQPRAPGRIPA